jgi:hypothetical protein
MFANVSPRQADSTQMKTPGCLHNRDQSSEMGRAELSSSPLPPSSANIASQKRYEEWCKAQISDPRPEDTVEMPRPAVGRPRATVHELG